MQIQRNGIAQAQMNVTPLIDVLLVLLIIFMVITPLTSHGLPALVPQPPAPAAAPAAAERAVVLEVAANGDLSINQRKLASRDGLSVRLQEIFSQRADRVLFLTAAPDAEYQQVARAIDEAKLHAAIALLPAAPLRDAPAR
jgi:biopolymer transport protein TolR